MGDASRLCQSGKHGRGFLSSSSLAQEGGWDGDDGVCGMDGGGATGISPWRLAQNSSGRGSITGAWFRQWRREKTEECCSKRSVAARRAWTGGGALRGLALL